MAEEQSLEQKITKWLDDQGFPLEMKVAQVLRDQGWFVIQSDYFEDPDDEKSREMDVRASSLHTYPELLLRLEITVECKAGREKPWLVFTSPDVRLAPPARVAQRVGNTFGRFLLTKFANFEAMEIFSLPVRPAYGVTQAFTKGNDVAYQAVMQASKSATALAIEAEKFNAPGAFGVGPPYCAVIFPVVVVEAPIFEVYLNPEDPTPIVKPVDDAVLVWRNRVAGMPHTIVHLVNVEAFPAFTDMATRSSHAIFEAVDSATEIRTAIAKAEVAKPTQS